MEVFPPKTTTAAEKVNEAVRDIAALKPHFMSVTYGAAGGGTSKYTIQIAKDIKDAYGVNSLAHLTCLSSTKETVEKQITLMKEAGIENILALRGDIPKETEFPLPGQFHYAAELVREIKRIAPEMCIGGACYPEGHPEANSKAKDILHIKEKVDAGCEFLTTQMFFDNSIFYNYLYRLNCGGDDYTDSFGQLWLQDNTNYSHSWAENFKDLNSYLASQRTTNDPIRATRDWKLFQHFRFGRHQLEYRFPVADGTYRIELYFTEPWHGTGGSASTDCEGLRIFDVAVNDSVVLDDLDIWAESGHDGVCRKVVYATVTGGMLRIHFPEVKAGQALISGIAIASTNEELKPTVFPASDWSWEKVDKEVMEKTPKELLPEDKNARVSISYEAETATLKGKFQKKEHRKQMGVFFGKGKGNSIEWNVSTGLAQVYALRFKYMNTTGKPMPVIMKFIDSKGVVLKEDILTFPETPDKWKMMSTTTGTFINAGHYKVLLSAENMDGLAFDALEVQ